MNFRLRRIGTPGTVSSEARASDAPNELPQGFRLRDLDAKLVRRVLIPSGEIYEPVGSVAEADGLMFLCPLCFHNNKGRRGTHMVLCWFVGRVPDNIDPKPGRWTPQGSSIDDITFVPGSGRSCSVLLQGACGWHGFVTNGVAK